MFGGIYFKMEKVTKEIISFDEEDLREFMYTMYDRGALIGFIAGCIFGALLFWGLTL